jgi:acyl-homoserine-lactone acylase
MHNRARAVLLPLLLLLTAAAPPDLQRWRDMAKRVTITRDHWGIAHIDGRSDADAVFGMIYAQAEDDFPRVETNYLTALGRTAEAEGEKAIWQDLRARLYVSESELRAHYAASPAWLQRLMNAWADGLNYYLATHPNVQPRVLRRFEPWMALSFTEGSIGGDIERIDLKALEKFYSGTQTASYAPPSNEPQGSNGIAVAPALTREGKALLLINPHTSFFFRSEQQVRSGEGLNAYGAATWGQFFIYQGFNENAGWMHTSSGVDNVDEFLVRTQRRAGKRMYRYGREWRELGARPVTIHYRTPDGRLAARSFTTWRTHRGPIVRSNGDQWVAFAMMDRPVPALQQSFLRTKTKDLQSFLNVAQLQANSSNNTIFADRSGAIAYLHPQFVPRRSAGFDYTKPVALSPASDWRSLHPVSELPSAVSPRNGWVQNTNSWPYRAAGRYSPDPARYPVYMDMFGPNFREDHALRLLDGSSDWTLDRLQAAAFDPYQPGFAELIPALVRAFDAVPNADPRRARLAGPVRLLRSWDYRWTGDSRAQSLASAWAEELMRLRAAPSDEPNNVTTTQLARRTSPAQKIQALETAVRVLQRDFGSWQVPWSEINRLQRLPSTGPQTFSDQRRSIPVPFTSARWGSLASFASKPMPGTKRWYGERGNSFVAVVEFGPRVRARAVSAGGSSGNPASAHFNDQSARYAAGALRDVYFYSEQLKGRIESKYRPGER